MWTGPPASDGSEEAAGGTRAERLLRSPDRPTLPPAGRPPGGDGVPGGAKEEYLRERGGGEFG